MKIRDWKRVTAMVLLLLVLLQFLGAPVQSVNAAQARNIKGTITVSSNISQQDMQQYLDGFNKKYPNIEVKYQSYSDYENEVSRQIADVDYSDVLFVPGSVSADKFADYFEELGTVQDDAQQRKNRMYGNRFLGDESGKKCGNPW